MMPQQEFLDRPHLLCCSLCDGCLPALSFLGLPLPLLLVELLGQLHLNHWHSRLGLGGRRLGWAASLVLHQRQLV